MNYFFIFSIVLFTQFLLVTQTYPAQLDWRNVKGTNYMSPIRDQGKCGACWAFATISAIESNIRINFGKRIFLSEQQLLDCCIFCRSHVNNSCNGGYVAVALNHIKEHGIIASSMYGAYMRQQQECKTTNRTVMLLDYDYIIGEKQIIEKLQKGPVITSICSKIKKLYSGGIFDTNEKCNNVATSHLVNIIGYGTDDNVPYWIVRNSWGDDWGEDGYFKIKRGVNLFMIETLAYSVNAIIVEDPTIIYKGTDDYGVPILEQIRNIDIHELLIHMLYGGLAGATIGLCIVYLLIKFKKI